VNTATRTVDQPRCCTVPCSGIKWQKDDERLFLITNSLSLYLSWSTVSVVWHQARVSSPISTVGFCVHSSSSSRLTVRPTRLHMTMDDRLCRCQQTLDWNTLTHHVTSASFHTPCFCSRLKAYLFQLSFPTIGCRSTHEFCTNSVYWCMTYTSVTLHPTSETLSLSLHVVLPQNYLAGSYQARAAGPPSLASRPAARPVQAVSADIQGSASTGTVVHRRPLSTSHNRR